MRSKLLIIFFIQGCTFLLLQGAYASDSLSVAHPDSLILSPDSSGIARDTMISRDAMTSKVKYHARDSIVFDVEEQKVFLYGKAQVNYEDIEMKAEYIDINWDTKIVYASGVKDSTGRLAGNPEFSESGNAFKAETMKYNFETKKGKITQVITHQDEGYIHGEVVKKDSSDTYFINHGAYTTCSLDTPHFYLSARKLKVIKDNKIITGPAYLVVEGVPTPLAVPFGIFPNKKGQSSGIVVPEYGEDTRGFFLAHGGYYFGISDHFDLEVLGNIYTHGDYALSSNTNYAKRYHYAGAVGLNYAFTQNTDKELPGYNPSKDFILTWMHRQDTKAHPGSQFNANVKGGTRSYYKNNLNTSLNDALNNTYSSSVSYTRSFKTSTLTANLNHDQNTLNKTLNMSLPNVSYSINRFSPFSIGKKVGEESWYEKITMGYTADLQNTINTYDSLFPKKIGFSDFKNGIRQVVPFNTSIKLMKYFTLSPNATYTERWYSKKTVFNWDSLKNKIDTTNVEGFNANRDFSTSVSLSTRLYGMYQLRHFPVKAIRHVLNPVLGYSWRPDFSEDKWGIYKSVQIDSIGHTRKYAATQNGIFGAPSAGKSSVISLALNNNLEMKTRSKKDTVTGEKKIKILESFNVNSGYNIPLDSCNLTPISITGGTVIFQRFNLNFSSVYNAYSTDSFGTNQKQFLYEKNGKLATMQSANASLSFSLNNLIFQSKDEKKKNSSSISALKANGYSEFHLPWNLSVSYSVNYNKIFIKTPSSKEITKALSFSGDLSPTSDWKINFSSGYDLEEKQFTPTSISILRDLHCWEMKFDCIPFGSRRRYYFMINVKSSVLHDLKLEKKKENIIVD